MSCSLARWPFFCSVGCRYCWGFAPAGAPPAPQKAPHSKAAHFILQDGDALVDVKCADEESMKICADITLQILDKLVALPKH